MHCIHVTDPATEDRADKLGKVWPFMSTLQQNFPCLFALGVALSIDEAMIKDQISDMALQQIVTSCSVGGTTDETCLLWRRTPLAGTS